MIDLTDKAEWDGMHLPLKNEFFPESLEVLPKNAEESKTISKILLDDKSIVFFKKDDEFNNSKLYIKVSLKTRDAEVGNST